MSNYSELLKDPRWQKKRLEIMSRDGWKCQECHSDQHTLHVHHKNYTYGVKPWEYDNAVFVTLCEGCHDLEESLKFNETFYAFAKSANITLISLWKLCGAYSYIVLTKPELREELAEMINKVTFTAEGEEKQKFLSHLVKPLKNG